MPCVDSMRIKGKCISYTWHMTDSSLGVRTGTSTYCLLRVRKVSLSVTSHLASGHFWKCSVFLGIYNHCFDLSSFSYDGLPLCMHLYLKVPIL